MGRAGWHVLFEDVSEGHGSVGEFMDEDGLQFTFQVVQHLQREDSPVSQGSVSGRRLGVYSCRLTFAVPTECTARPCLER